MPETQPNTVIDLLSIVLAATSTAKMHDDPVEYFAFRGALIDLVSAHKLASETAKSDQSANTIRIAKQLREQTGNLMKLYMTSVKPNSTTINHATLH